MAEHILTLVNSKKYNEAVIIGCGPSLDDFDHNIYNKKHQLTIGINYAASIIPCNWAIYLDECGKDFPILPPADIIRPDWFKEHHNNSGYLLDMEKIPEGSGVGTVVMATFLARFTGVKKILYVGCDSVDNVWNEKAINEYASCLYEYLPKKNRHKYLNINKTLLEFITILDIDARWFHRGEDL